MTSTIRPRTSTIGWRARNLLLSQQRHAEAVGLARATLAFLNGGGTPSACILATALLSDAYGLRFPDG